VFLDCLVLTPVARTGVRTSFCALGWPPFAGAALVRRWPLSSLLRWWPPQVRPPTTKGIASTNETVSATCGRTSGSLALMACSCPACGGRGPSHSSVCLEAIIAAVLPPEAEVVIVAGVVVAREPLGVPCLAAPLVWR
jgi:hypothetical protein